MISLYLVTYFTIFGVISAVANLGFGFSIEPGNVFHTSIQISDYTRLGTCHNHFVLADGGKKQYGYT